MKVTEVGLGYDHAVVDALGMAPPPHLADLTGVLGREVGSLPGYEEPGR